jgi:hypothetical protein
LYEELALVTKSRGASLNCAGPAKIIDESFDDVYSRRNAVVANAEIGPAPRGYSVLKVSPGPLTFEYGASARVGFVLHKADETSTLHAGRQPIVSPIETDTLAKLGLERGVSCSRGRLVE